MNHQDNIFTREKLADAIHIWNRCSITLLDVRHNLISQEDALINYRLPASAFLYTRGEKAEVCLDSTFYNMERFGVFHSYKGAELTITPQCKWLEYYLVLYKAGEPPFHKGEFGKLLARINPFRQQYGFLPASPLFFGVQLRKMYEKWKGPTPLNLFYGKATFYQLVYEIYEELEQGRIQVLEPDVVTIAKRYLDKHYKDSIAIQELCDSLGISYSHFHRSFKQQTGKSPQEYLIKARLCAAMEALKRGDSSVREVAIHCGFPDEVNFYRQFVKHVGIAPSAYKQIPQRDMRDAAVENSISFSYNEESQVSNGELEGKGATFMFKQIRAKAVVAAALSVMLLVSACGMVPANTGGVDSTPAVAAATQAAETEAAITVQEGMRTIHTVMGDVEVPVNPKRVVVDYLIGDVVALGVTPMGVAKSENENGKTAFADKITESVAIESWGMDAEEVMALEPDLIILAFSQTPYEDLSKIAPTVYVPYGSMTTEERVRFIGDVLNCAQASEEVLSAYNEKIAAAKQTLRDAGLADVQVTIGQFTDDGSYLAGAKHAAGVVVYNELALKAPEKVQTDIIDKDEYWGTPSLEVLETFCGDYMISLGEIPSTLHDNPVWQSIPAVRNERIIGTNTAITWYTDIISSGALVDIIVDGLLELAAKE